MHLAEFILSNMEPILAEWERFARGLTPGGTMNVVALRDHAEAILRVTAKDMLSAQTGQQQADKSKGLGGGGAVSERLDRVSEEHAVGRLGSGFNLMEVVAEYRALRASVPRLWRESVGEAGRDDLQDLTRFHESIDQSLAEAVKGFTSSVDESRELFLATLGHDLRTPLSAIVVSAELLARSGQLDDENTQIAAQIGSFGKVMASMIHDLLDFTRTRLGAGMPVSVAPLDLEHLCREVLEEFHAAHPDRTIDFDSTGDATGQWDAARLRQVLTNLVANAIAHGDEISPIEISLKAEGEGVVLTITNQGTPIPDSALRTLFDPFVRGEASARSHRASGGIGLGLYIVREIVIAHGGTISVGSSETGTTFTVRLPRNQ